jgi:methylenetetrahydrofolate dehydrogenase (NADP+)/methenyltetrahydrofolate cyclohydrolase
VGSRIIDGNGYSAELQRGLAEDVADLLEQGIRPGLATLLAGSREAVDSYERRARRLAEELGYYYRCEHLSGDADEAEMIATVEELNADPRVSGVLVLRPLPEGVSEAAVYGALDPTKDIEAQHPENAGLLALGRPRYEPSTAASCFYLLDRYLEDSGRDPAEFYRKSTITVVGRSETVGKPAVSLGYERGAAVISCDKNASDSGRLAEYTGQADALIVAAGVPGLVTAEHVREGAIVLDVGTNPVTDPETGEVRLAGDVDLASVASKAEAVSPVPGGVGTVTYAQLLVNVAEAARSRLKSVSREWSL